MPHLPEPECDKPGCTNSGSRRYQDANGNTLNLCPDHYYQQVSGAYTITRVASDEDESPRGILDLFK